MLKTIAEETWFYILEHDDETGEYIVDVACGTVAIYTIKFDTKQTAFTANANHAREVG